MRACIGRVAAYNSPVPVSSSLPSPLGPLSPQLWVNASLGVCVKTDRMPLTSQGSLFHRHTVNRPTTYFDKYNFIFSHCFRCESSEILVMRHLCENIRSAQRPAIVRLQTMLVRLCHIHVCVQYAAVEYIMKNGCSVEPRYTCLSNAISVTFTRLLSKQLSCG